KEGRGVKEGKLFRILVRSKTDKARQSTKDLELLRSASACFAQELTSLRSTAEAHQELRRHTGLGYAVVRNSLILAFAVHFRNVFDFLYSGQNENSPPKDDVLAEHFFDIPEEW